MWDVSISHISQDWPEEFSAVFLQQFPASPRLLHILEWIDTLLQLSKNKKELHRVYELFTQSEPTLRKKGYLESFPS